MSSGPYLQTINLKLKLQSPDDLDSTMDKLINLLQEAALQSTPPQVPQDNVNDLPLEIKQLLKEKRKARAIWHRSRNPADKTKFNHLTNKLKTKLKQMREESFKEYLNKLNKYDQSIWKPIKNARKPKAYIPPIRQTTPQLGPWAKSDAEKAELFAQHFSNIFTPHTDDIDHEMEQNLARISETGLQITLTTPREIQKEIKLLGLKKAPGIDKITPKMLKELPNTRGISTL